MTERGDEVMERETILIVEDDWILSAHLQNVLTGYGYNVMEPVTSGEEAILSVAARQPDLILMDIELSGEISGITASRHIGAISDIPVIFLSNHSEDAFVQEAKTASPYGYLVKPVFDRELAVTIEMVMYRHKLNQRLKESEERFRNLFQNVTSVAVQGYSADGSTLYWNQASENLYGYTAQEAIGRNLLDLIIPPEMRVDVERAIQQMANTGQGIPASELSFMRKDGSRVAVFSSHTVLQSLGHAPELFCLNVDLTERKQVEKEKAELEAQNRQLQKAESLGRMAGAIAHHFNNMLAVSIGNLELAIMDLPPGSDVLKNLIQAMEASRKAAEVSSLMLTYLGQTPGKHEPLDISDICHLGLSMLRAVIPNKVIVETELPSPGPTIRANTNQMHQVLTNLITNVWESIGDNGGTIRLIIKTVSSADIPASHCFPIDYQPLSIPYACMEVTDTGCGISDNDIEKIFDPFFTTKFTGRGMGLPVVLGIVRAHNGAVSVESEPGRGSVFRVFLPVSTEEISLQQEKIVSDQKSAGSLKGGGTVLLIEDEEQVRKMAGIMLSRLGYTVLEAKDGVEAVEIFQQHQDEIRCVLSDLTMPRMDGWETLTALRKLSPDIPIILSSGYDEARVMAGEHPERPNAFIGKPYQLKGLGDMIRRVLSA
jgi:two-component system, cell cycle sensor histidine kinase and response regulator CckA